MIIERFKSRLLLAVSGEISDLAHDHYRTIEDRIEAAQGQLVKLVDEAPRDEWVGAYEGMTAHTQVLEDRASGKTKAWATGLTDLDDVLDGGFRPGELIIIGARPSMGKSALGVSIGLHMAKDYSVGMLSMEMPKNDVFDRMTSILGRVSLSHVKRPSRGLEWERVVDGIERAKSLKFNVNDKGGFAFELGEFCLLSALLQLALRDLVGGDFLDVFVWVSVDLDHHSPGYLSSFANNSGVKK